MTTDQSELSQPVLRGMRVLDLAHQYSGALSASLLADLGADVITVEHPNRSPIRSMLPRTGEDSLWWKVVQRGKRAITLDISTEVGRELILELAREADIITENFRPGTLEKWKLGPKDLEAEGISVVMLRISGFGQSGPNRNRPGFGTIAEAYSGFAHLNGEPDGPPMFPSTTLADGVTAVFGAFGLMAAMWNRAAHGTPEAYVEVVDVALFESLFRIIPTQIASVDQLNYVPKRPGNSLASHGVLRSLYQSSDDRWFVISAVGPVPIRRVLTAIEHAELLDMANNDIMDAPQEQVVQFIARSIEEITKWSAKLDFDTITQILTDGDVVFQAVYAADDIIRDEHYIARGDVISVPDPRYGPIKMQGVVPKFPARDHTVAYAGPDQSSHNWEIFVEMLGVAPEQLSKMNESGIV